MIQNIIEKGVPGKP